MEPPFASEEGVDCGGAADGGRRNPDGRGGFNLFHKSVGDDVRPFKVDFRRRYVAVFGLYIVVFNV